MRAPPNVPTQPHEKSMNDPQFALLANNQLLGHTQGREPPKAYGSEGPPRLFPLQGHLGPKKGDKS